MPAYMLVIYQNFKYYDIIKETKRKLVKKKRSNAYDCKKGDMIMSRMINEERSIYMESKRNKGKTNSPKRVKVSSKRQITIPSSFYKKLELGTEVECFIRESKNELVIRPVQSEMDFSENILKELIDEGYSGKQLLKEFKKKKETVKPAVNKMIDEAEAQAEKLENTGNEEIEEIFGDLEQDK